MTFCSAVVFLRTETRTDHFFFFLLSSRADPLSLSFVVMFCEKLRSAFYLFGDTLNTEQDPSFYSKTLDKDEDEPPPPATTCIPCSDAIMQTFTSLLAEMSERLYM